MNKVPLKLYFLAHQRSESGMEMARSLVRYFQEPPVSGGLRLPAFLTPDLGDDLPPAWGAEGIDLDSAEHTVVVVLSDARMARRVNRGTGAEWKAFLEDGIQKNAGNEARHRIFGVALDQSGFSLSDTRHVLRVKAAPESDASDGEEADWMANTIEDLALEITVQMIQLLEPRAVPSSGRAPVNLFLSHAKRDLKEDETDPVRMVEEDLKELPINHWIDLAEIPPGKDFADAIREGIRDCSIVLAFLTDSYASRSWCLREILDAKKQGVPILVVDALDTGEPRNFPYLGNLPVVHWTMEPGRAEQKRMARKVVGRAIRESLKSIHNRALLMGGVSENEKVLSAAPEALSLVWNTEKSENSRTFLYPDPPLIHDELEVLKELRPNSNFVTPLTKVARRKLPDSVSSIAVSISESGDLARFGLAPFQEASISDEIHLYLLLAGLQIAYGGAVNSDTTKASNFTLRLFELVRSYSDLANRVGAGDLHPILNYAPWPLRLGYGDREFNLFGEIADYIECHRPSEEEVPEADEELFPEKSDGWRYLPSDPAQRLAWSRGLTLMRKQSTKETQARVVIGGKMDGYFGLFPGVVEEAWHSILAAKPLYLVGAFGGAAQAVIEGLQGNGDPILESCGRVQELSETIALAEERGGGIVDSSMALSFDALGKEGKLPVADRLVTDLRTAGEKGFEEALQNGLDESENHELFQSTDPARISELILRGLSRLKS